MSDNVQLDAGSGGAVVRTIDKLSKQVPVSIIDVGNHANDDESFIQSHSVGMPVEGLADDGTAIVGAPVLIGGTRHDSSATDLSVNQAGVLSLDNKRNLKTSVFGGGTSGANALDIDSDGAVKLSGMQDSVIDFDTDQGETKSAACFGIVVPSSTGPVAVTGDANGLNVTVSNFPSSQTVSGSVSVSNFPTNQTVSGSVGVSNFPSTQTVDGTVSVGNFPSTQTVDGTVSVGNFPATQTVDGTVNVGNFPSSQAVTGTVGVNNFPATQTVDGTVSVGNFPATQTVDGTVNVGNFPVTQSVTGTVNANVSFPASQVVDLATNNDVRIVGSASDGLDLHSSVTYTSGIVTLGGATNRCLYSISAFNLTNNKLFLKFFSASNPVLGTTPASMTFLIPANSSNGAGFVFSIPQGMDIGNNGIQYAITTGVSQSSTTGVNSGDVIINLAFE